MHITTVYTIVVLVGLGMCSLRVQAPQDLADYFANKYPEGLLPYSIANYGNVPYGKTLSGQVGIPSILQDCVFQDLPEEQQNKPILLVQRNDCSFTQKSLNVQKEGGKLAVIMDNRSEDPNSIVMVDDGRGSKVHIPTVLISHEDGQKILQALRRSSVVLSFAFVVEAREKASLRIWLDIAEHQNMVFLRKLRPYFNKISQHVDFSVAYPTRACSTCQESDCFYNGSYCRSDFKYSGVDNKGQLIIMQQLRQYYLFQQSPQKWWDYVLSFDQICGYLATMEQCSAKIMKRVGASTSIHQQAKTSFGTEDNQVLRAMSAEKYNNSIVYYPSVIVNNFIYRGNLQPFQVYQLICQSLDTEPQGCSGYLTPTSTNLHKWIIFIVIATILFGIFMVVCYRRIARRQLTQKINTQVNQLVNQYITMYEHDRYNQGTELPNRPNPS